MTEPTIPQPEQIKQIIARYRRGRQELALAAIELQDFILKLEELDNHTRKQQLEKRLNLNS